jgi:hypothetical protein
MCYFLTGNGVWLLLALSGEENSCSSQLSEDNKVGHPSGYQVSQRQFLVRVRTSKLNIAPALLEGFSLQSCALFLSIYLLATR